MRQDYVVIQNRAQNVWQATIKLSSFKPLLREHCRTVSSVYGVSLEIRDRALTSAFFEWAHKPENHAEYLRRNAPDYYQFLIGSLLAELLKVHAVEEVPGDSSEPAPQKDNVIAKYWPGGYALTLFCVEIARLVIAQECSQIVATSDKFDNLKVWQSFRENLIEEPSIAIAYFDDFMGVTPNWSNPSSLDDRPATHEAVSPRGAGESVTLPFVR